jgi:hypothetical protein
LTLCLLGAITAFGKLPDTSYSFGNSGYVPGSIGFGMLCVAIVFIVIAVVVPILLLRKKKPAPEAAPVEVPPPPQEPLPPAS